MCHADRAEEEILGGATRRHVCEAPRATEKITSPARGPPIGAQPLSDVARGRADQYREREAAREPVPRFERPEYREPEEGVRGNGRGDERYRGERGGGGDYAERGALAAAADRRAAGASRGLRSKRDEGGGRAPLGSYEEGGYRGAGAAGGGGRKRDQAVTGDFGAGAVGRGGAGAGGAGTEPTGGYGGMGAADIGGGRGYAAGGGGGGGRGVLPATGTHESAVTEYQDANSEVGDAHRVMSL